MSLWSQSHCPCRLAEIWGGAPWPLTGWQWDSKQFHTMHRAQVWLISTPEYTINTWGGSWKSRVSVLLGCVAMFQMTNQPALPHQPSWSIHRNFPPRTIYLPPHPLSRSTVGIEEGCLRWKHCWQPSSVVVLSTENNPKCFFSDLDTVAPTQKPTNSSVSWSCMVPRGQKMLKDREPLLQWWKTVKLANKLRKGIETDVWGSSFLHQGSNNFAIFGFSNGQ